MNYKCHEATVLQRLTVGCGKDFAHKGNMRKSQLGGVLRYIFACNYVIIIIYIVKMHMYQVHTRL